MKSSAVCPKIYRALRNDATGKTDRRLFDTKPPRRSGVATSANCEIIIAERALPIVTGRAALTAAARVMIQRFGRGDLTSLGQSAANLMTVVAVRLWIMLGVAKSHPERRHVL